MNAAATLDVGLVGHLARETKKLDVRAKAFRELMLEKPILDLEEFGLEFSAVVESNFDFRVIVHRIPLIVKYEQRINQARGAYVLLGVIRAYIDEPLRVDKKIIVSITFNKRGETESPGSLVEDIAPEDYYRDNVRRNFVLLLLRHVQQYLVENPIA